MRLYRIEAIGFKSFKEKVILEIPEGIIGIVGPNGCGKSNVVDAIKWALGEQNPRHLRAKAMEDIIFAGTSEHPPAGFAEVSLYFRREKEPFPEPYSSLAELVITRRLYRSGESEYLINRAQCRLKDIIDITIDTGLGQRFYGLIEQGMVESFMNYRPEEKRLIFEEVAGTAKYRLRKKATIQKLESAKLNLSRIEDILAEVSSRCNELEKEAKRALEYKKIYEELKRIELYKNAVQFAELNRTLVEKRKDLQRLEADLQDKELQAKSLEAELESKRNELFFLEQNYENVKKELFGLGETILKLEKELNVLREGKEYREKKLTEIESQKCDLISRINSLKSRLEGVAKELRECEGGLAEKENILRSYEKKEGNLSGHIREITNEINNLQSTIHKEKNQIAYASSQMEYEERLLKDTTEKILKGKEERTSLESEIEQSKVELENEKRSLREKEREREGFIAKLDELNRAIVAEKKAASELRRKLQEKELRRERLLGAYNSSKKFVEEYKGFSSGAQYVLKNFSKEVVLGTLLEHMEISEEILYGIENFLKEQLELIFVKDYETAKSAISYLKGGNLGNCSLISLSSIRDGKIDESLSTYLKVSEPYQRAVGYILSNLKVVKNLDEALERYLAGERTNFITLEGEVLTEKGIVRGGSKGRHNPFLVEKTKLKELESELNQLAKEIDNEREAIRERENYIRSLEEKIGQTKEELATLELDLSDQRTEVRVKEEEFKRKALKLEHLTSEIKNLELNLASYERKKSELKEKIERLTEEVERKEKVLSEAERRLEEVKVEMEGLRGEITRIKVELAEERRNLLHKREEKDRIAKELSQLERQVEHLLKEEEALKNIANDAEKKLKTCEEEIKKVWEEKERKSAKLNEEESVINNLKVEVREGDKKLSQLRSETERCRKALFARKEELGETELKLELIKERVREKYYVDIERHFETYLAYTVSEEECSDAYIEEMWKKLRDMGEVNLLSIDEYEEVKNRYEFLMRQKKDIEDSIESLNNAIERINKISLELFLNSVKGIEENFDKLFKRLFGGGKARILLTDESNPLESGVEIAVELPFKKLQNIELLSGGEKALVAISLMFAFYMQKPSPFCLLDEVDAPLDDANVVKFRELLKEMSKFSQFMVVTHNKLVMEYANILYGVTMETPGISKIVSVKAEREELWQ